MANSKYFETTLRNKNEIYSIVHGGGEVLGGGTILFILKISTEVGALSFMLWPLQPWDNGTAPME